MTLDIKMVCQLTKPLKVLYVEDDFDLRTETSLFFKHFFDDISTADDGLDALEKIATSSFDLIISDINMPNMDGIEMAKRILKSNPDQTFIFISAHDDSTHLMQLMELGITKFIAKPFKSAQLLQTLYETAQAFHENKDMHDYYEGVLEENVKNIAREKTEKTTLLSKENIEPIVPTPSIEDSIIKHPAKAPEASQGIEIDIGELIDIYEEIDSLVAMKCLHPENSFSREDSIYFAKLFNRYASILASFQMFHKISQKIHDMAACIESHDAPDDLSIQAYLFTLIESFLKVLSKWQESWKEIEDDDEKLHFWDQSIITDLDTIIMTWENKHLEDDGAHDIDFF